MLYQANNNLSRKKDAIIAVFPVYGLSWRAFDAFPPLWIYVYVACNMGDGPGKDM